MKALLEDLFGPDWFDSPCNQTHPAYQHWYLCKENNEHHGANRFYNPAVKLQLGRLILDTYVFSTVTNGDVGLATLGDMAAIGDEIAVKKIRNSIVDPDKYEDVMIELVTAAWHRGRGHRALIQEVSGQQDLIVEIPEISTTLQIECKHLTSHSPNRLAAIVKKANEQIKAGKRGDSIGVLILDATAYLTSDNERDELFDRVHRALSGQKNRSVRHAIVTWDIVGEKADENNEYRRHLVFTRNQVAFHHSDWGPRVSDVEALFQGYRVEITVNMEPPPLGGIPRAIMPM